MAIEWMVCAECGQRRNPTYEGLSLRRTSDNFGDHINNGERCPGSDTPPKETFWGDSCGLKFEEYYTE
jgi:hypothetical protein